MVSFGYEYSGAAAALDEFLSGADTLEFVCGYDEPASLAESAPVHECGALPASELADGFIDREGYRRVFGG